MSEQLFYNGHAGGKLKLLIDTIKFRLMSDLQCRTIHIPCIDLNHQKSLATRLKSAFPYLKVSPKVSTDFGQTETTERYLTYYIEVTND